jgi:hypothetical protein
MITKNTNILIFGLLVLLGATFLTYGAFFHLTNVSAQQQDDPTIVAKSEPALIKEASVGGVTLDESGKIKQTYTGKAPEECST